MIACIAGCWGAEGWTHLTRCPNRPHDPLIDVTELTPHTAARTFLGTVVLKRDDGYADIVMRDAVLEFGPFKEKP